CAFPWTLSSRLFKRVIAMTKRSLFYKRRPNPADIRKKRWNVWRIMGTAVRRTCYVLGAIMLIWILLSASVVMMMGGGRNAPLPDKMVVLLKLDRGFAEKSNAPSLLD